MTSLRCQLQGSGSNVGVALPATRVVVVVMSLVHAIFPVGSGHTVLQAGVVGVSQWAAVAVRGHRCRRCTSIAAGRCHFMFGQWPYVDIIDITVVPLGCRYDGHHRGVAVGSRRCHCRTSVGCRQVSSSLLSCLCMRQVHRWSRSWLWRGSAGWRRQSPCLVEPTPPLSPHLGYL